MYLGTMVLYVYRYLCIEDEVAHFANAEPWRWKGRRRRVEMSEGIFIVEE